MKAPKKFVNYIENGNLKKVKQWLIDASYGDCDNAENIRIVDKPKGEYQGEGEYCLQSTLSSESGVYAYEGTYYHQIENSDKYVAYDYYLSN